MSFTRRKKKYVKSQDKALKKKILLTLLILVVIRVLAAIPVPFINREYLKLVMSQTAAFNFMNVMSGNSLENFSVMALSVTPYITASIIMQLLGVLMPSIQKMQEGMKDDRDKYERITEIMGIILAALQALGMSLSFGSEGLLTSYKWYTVTIVTAILTAGTAVCVVAGKYITDKLFGNGISLILVTNILASYFPDLRSAVITLINGHGTIHNIVALAIFAAAVFLLHMFVIFIQASEKDVPVVYASNTGANKSSIPIKLCPANVVPVIFASSLLSIPDMIAMIAKKTWNWTRFFNSSYWFNPSYPVYSVGVILYALLIVGFSYYYIGIFMSPDQIADNLKKTGGNIPGIRQGKPTADYLRRQMKYLIFIGAVAMCVVAFVPILASGLLSLSRLAFFGTSLIIVSGVILETKTAYDTERLHTKAAKKAARFL